MTQYNFETKKYNIAPFMFHLKHGKELYDYNYAEFVFILTNINAKPKA